MAFMDPDTERMRPYLLCLDFSILLSCSLFYKISEVEPVTRSRSLNMLTGAGLKVWLRHRLRLQLRWKRKIYERFSFKYGQRHIKNNALEIKI